MSKFPVFADKTEAALAAIKAIAVKSAEDPKLLAFLKMATKDKVAVMVEKSRTSLTAPFVKDAAVPVAGAWTVQHGLSTIRKTMLFAKQFGVDFSSFVLSDGKTYTWESIPRPMSAAAAPASPAKPPAAAAASASASAAAAAAAPKPAVVVAAATADAVVLKQKSFDDDSKLFIALAGPSLKPSFEMCKGPDVSVQGTDIPSYKFNGFGEAYVSGLDLQRVSRPVLFNFKTLMEHFLATGCPNDALHHVSKLEDGKFSHPILYFRVAFLATYQKTVKPQTANSVHMDKLKLVWKQYSSKAEEIQKAEAKAAVVAEAKATLAAELKAATEAKAKAAADLKAQAVAEAKAKVAALEAKALAKAKAEAKAKVDAKVIADAAAAAAAVAAASVAATESDEDADLKREMKAIEEKRAALKKRKAEAAAAAAATAVAPVAAADSSEPAAKRLKPNKPESAAAVDLTGSEPDESNKSVADIVPSPVATHVDNKHSTMAVQKTPDEEPKDSKDSKTADEPETAAAAPAAVEPAAGVSEVNEVEDARLALEAALAEQCGI